MSAAPEDATWYTGPAGGALDPGSGREKPHPPLPAG